MDGDDPLLEQRIENFIDMTRDIAARVNAATWLGDTFLQLATALFVDSSDATEISRRIPVLGSDVSERSDSMPVRVGFLLLNFVNCENGSAECG